MNQPREHEHTLDKPDRKPSEDYVGQDYQDGQVEWKIEN